MALETLLLNAVPAPASYGTTRTAAPKLRVAVFGDGYETVAPVGIDHNLLVLNVSFSNLTAEDRAALIAFLDARGGYEAFKWTAPAPYDSERFYRCKEWSDGWDEFNAETVFAKMEEVKVPGES